MKIQGRLRSPPAQAKGGRNLFSTKMKITKMGLPVKHQTLAVFPKWVDQVGSGQNGEEAAKEIQALSLLFVEGEKQHSLNSMH